MGPALHPNIPPAGAMRTYLQKKSLKFGIVFSMRQTSGNFFLDPVSKWFRYMDGEKISPKEAIEENSSKEFSMEYQRGADPPAREMHASLAAARDDVTAPLIAASTSDTTASPASLNWADSEMAEVDANEGFTVVKTKKRRRTSSPEHAAKQPGRPAEKPSSQQQKRPTGPKSMPPQEIKATRANIAAARARQDTTNHENYIFVELCPDIPDYSYLKAIGMLVGGPGRISQFNRMNGHYVVGLATKDQASRLVEAGLDIDGTHLKVFPFRKRAERIVIANLPGFVEDSAIVEALRNFGTVTSIAPIMIKMGEYTFNDGRREAFILLREGVRLESLPTRMTIKSKGDTLSAFLSFGIKGADPPAREMHASLAAARDDVTAPLIAASTSDTTASPASLNWADSEMAEVDANEGFTVVKTKKRRRTSSPEHAAKQPGRPAEKPSSQQQKRPTGRKSMPPQEIKATRANIAAARARQDTTNHENYIFVELCPDIPDYSYLKAIGMLVGGPGRISQFNRMNGHYVVGLATKDQASRLVEAGLDIDGTHLKVFPFRKRAERIVIANLPGFVEDSAIVEALRNFGTVTSIAPIMIKMGEYTFNDGRREAFILLREGVRLESLPTRMTIKSKGDTLSAFLSFGIKCSKCGKQGHRRANCPALARQGNGSPRQTATPTDARPPPPPPPPPPQQPRRPAPAPATPVSPVQPAKTPTEAPAIPSAPHPAEPKDLSQPAPVTLPAPMAAPRPLEPAILPLDIEMSEEERTSTPSTPSKGIPAIIQLREHLEKLPSIAINHSGLLGLDWEDAQKLLASPTNMKKRVPSLLETQVTAFTELAKIIMDSCPNSSTLVYKTLQKTRTVLLIGRPK
ncbi:hypothetical protein LAZ67_14002941 [Cordylochernes scorpioides]|uniref:CCHC-type domain-containing protein n=1 Tax=Cordylochernes scorpioides TaxID=51811 RepID=A0ABY6L988_9ARAC|nr:hypothetical protein LAZ67_14002941 [Cordylochernes scorpioides]